MYIMDNKQETVSIDSIKPHPLNPRRGNVEAIAASIRENGFYGVIGVWAKERIILFGEHRWRAAKLVGMTEVPVLMIDAEDEAHAQAILLSDNRTSDLSTWSYGDLQKMLSEYQEKFHTLERTGFTDTYLEKLLERGKAKDPDRREKDFLDFYLRLQLPKEPGMEETARALFSLADITIGEPVTKLTHGDVRELGRHTLVVAGVMSDWSTWIKYLVDDTLLCLYPGPFVLLAPTAKKYPLLMIQPEPYIAGHIVDIFNGLEPTTPKKE